MNKKKFFMISLLCSVVAPVYSGHFEHKQDETFVKSDPSGRETYEKHIKEHRDSKDRPTEIPVKVTTIPVVSSPTDVKYTTTGDKVTTRRVERENTAPASSYASTAENVEYSRTPFAASSDDMLVPGTFKVGTIHEETTPAGGKKNYAIVAETVTPDSPHAPLIQKMQGKCLEGTPHYNKCINDELIAAFIHVLKHNPGSIQNLRLTTQDGLVLSKSLSDAAISTNGESKVVDVSVSVSSKPIHQSWWQWFFGSK